MEKFVSSWSNGEILPESYIFPPANRPGNQAVLIDETVPVIDLSKANGDDRACIVHQIIEAAQELGFFQVINHGVPTRLMEDTTSVFKEFFDLPSEEKSGFISEDPSKKCVLTTSNVDYDKEDVHNWRDTLRQECSPLEECIKHWPQKPPLYREVVGEYSIKVREVGWRILEIICEGLEFEPGYFGNELSQGHVIAVHRYPPCPNPSLTVGTRKHCDPGLLTILVQDIPGLQVLKNSEWIGVDAIPNAFVVFVGHQLQIVSNGKLKSAEHRVVTNKEKTRMSAAFFMEPAKDCLVEPEKGIVNGENPAKYKCVKYEDFVKTFKEVYVRGSGDVLEPYTIGE